MLSFLNFEAPGREPFFALDPGVNYGEGTAVVERLRAESGCEDKSCCRVSSKMARSSSGASKPFCPALDASKVSLTPCSRRSLADCR